MTDVLSKKSFISIWSAHAFFLIFLRVSLVALSFFIIKKTGSITYFAYLALAGTIPNIIFLPLISGLLDKHRLKITLTINMIFFIFSTLILAFTLNIKNINMWAICAVFTLYSLGYNLQNVLFDKAITVLVKPSFYDNAIVLIRGANAFSYLIGPLIAGILLTVFSISTVFLFALAYVILYIIVIQITIPIQIVANTVVKSSAHGYKNTYNEIIKSDFSKQILYLYGISFIWMNIANTLLIPILAENMTEKMSGIVLSFSGLGILLGFLSLFILRFKNKLIAALCAAYLLIGCQLLLSCVKASYLLATVLFIGSFFSAITQGLSQGIAQSSIPYEFQGRFFAIRTAISFFIMCLSYIMAGPFAEYIIKPMLFYAIEHGILNMSFFGDGNSAALRVVFLLLAIPALIYLFYATKKIIFKSKSI